MNTFWYHVSVELIIRQDSLDIVNVLVREFSRTGMRKVCLSSLYSKHDIPLICAQISVGTHSQFEVMVHAIYITPRINTQV